MPTHPRAAERPPIIVVMGVAGSGKTTVARLLAERLRCAMLEGDDLHSAENLRHMAAATPLTDTDRADWLRAIAERITQAACAGHGLVVACSALKRRYRDVLRAADPHLRLVYLSGGPEIIRRRISARREHFMPPALLDDQFDALQTPSVDEGAIRCDVELPPAQIVTSVLEVLAAQPPAQPYNRR